MFKEIQNTAAAGLAALSFSAVMAPSAEAQQPPPPNPGCGTNCGPTDPGTPTNPPIVIEDGDTIVQQQQGVNIHSESYAHGVVNPASMGASSSGPCQNANANTFAVNAGAPTVGSAGVAFGRSRVEALEMDTTDAEGNPANTCQLSLEASVTRVLEAQGDIKAELLAKQGMLSAGEQFGEYGFHCDLADADPAYCERLNAAFLRSQQQGYSAPAQGYVTASRMTIVQTGFCPADATERPNERYRIERNGNHAMITFNDGDTMTVVDSDAAIVAALDGPGGCDPAP